MAQSPSNCLRKSTASRATKMRADSGMLSIESPERRRPVGGQQRRTRRTAGRRAVGHRCRARCTRRNRRPEHPRKGRRPGGARRTLAAVASSDGDDTHGCSASRRECPIAWRGRRRTRRCGHARRGVGRWLRAGGPEGGRGGGRCGMMSSAHGRTTGRAIPGGVPGTVTDRVAPARLLRTGATARAGDPGRLPERLRGWGVLDGCSPCHPTRRRRPLGRAVPSRRLPRSSWADQGLRREAAVARDRARGDRQWSAP